MQINNWGLSTGYSALDLPFSCVGDTLFLPIDLMAWTPDEWGSRVITVPAPTHLGSQMTMKAGTEPDLTATNTAELK
jgi:hypothetical protein